MSLVDPAAIVALFEKVPDRVVVLVGHRVVRVVPVHPVAEPDRLIGDALGIFPDALLAAIDELGDAIRFDIALALESELFFDLDFDPETLAVEAVLISLLFAEHGLEALEEILVGATPAVMDAHRVIGGHWAVDESVAFRGALVAFQVRLHDPFLGPPGEDLPLHGGEIGFGDNFLKAAHTAVILLSASRT